jgi:hypothetical protein
MESPRNVSEWLARYRWTPRARREDARTVPTVLRWLGQQDVDDAHVEWSVREARQLLFVLWLLEHGRLDQLMPDPSVVFLETKAGRIHKAVRLDGERYTNEACNLDDAVGGERELTFAELERADADALCRRCWPPATQTGRS